MPEDIFSNTLFLYVKSLVVYVTHAPKFSIWANVLSTPEFLKIVFFFYDNYKYLDEEMLAL